MIEVVDYSHVESDNLKRVVTESDTHTAAQRLGAWPWRWLLTGRPTRRAIARE